jgi:hypothetical protein
MPVKDQVDGPSRMPACEALRPPEIQQKAP